MNLPPHLANLGTNSILSSNSTITKSNISNQPKNSTDIPQLQRKRLRKFKSRKDVKKKWKVLRKAAGEVWEDPTLEDWPDNDFRVFCGDLGNEVTDEILANAFRKYPSFLKARVIRDKRSSKSKGFGFISFANSDDYIKAMREMNGKYVGNRPIRMSRSTWKDRSIISNKSKVEVVRFKKNKPKIRNKTLLNNANMIEMGYGQNNFPQQIGYNNAMPHQAMNQHYQNQNVGQGYRNNNTQHSSQNNFQGNSTFKNNPRTRVNNSIIYK
jgi:RNA recognition motif-containing protein